MELAGRKNICRFLNSVTRMRLATSDQYALGVYKTTTNQSLRHAHEAIPDPPPQRKAPHIPIDVLHTIVNSNREMCD